MEACANPRCPYDRAAPSLETTANKPGNFYSQCYNYFRPAKASFLYLDSKHCPTPIDSVNKCLFSSNKGKSTTSCPTPSLRLAQKIPATRSRCRTTGILSTFSLRRSAPGPQSTDFPLPIRSPKDKSIPEGPAFLARIASFLMDEPKTKLYNKTWVAKKDQTWHLQWFNRLMRGERQHRIAEWILNGVGPDMYIRVDWEGTSFNQPCIAAGNFLWQQASLRLK